MIGRERICLFLITFTKRKKVKWEAAVSFSWESCSKKEISKKISAMDCNFFIAVFFESPCAKFSWKFCRSFLNIFRHGSVENITGWLIHVKFYIFFSVSYTTSIKISWTLNSNVTFCRKICLMFFTVIGLRFSPLQGFFLFIVITWPEKYFLWWTCDELYTT